MVIDGIRHYTTHEVAQILNVGIATIQGWCKTKKIRFIVTLGGHRRIPEQEIERLREIMKTKGNNELEE